MQSQGLNTGGEDKRWRVGEWGKRNGLMDSSHKLQHDLNGCITLAVIVQLVLKHIHQTRHACKLGKLAHRGSTLNIKKKKKREKEQLVVQLTAQE